MRVASIMTVVFLLTVTVVIAGYGGGGDGLVISEANRITIDYDTFDVIKEVLLDASYDVRLTAGRLYPMRVDSLTSSSATFSFKKGNTVTSTISLPLGESARVDLDLDGLDDIVVTLDLLRSSSASITVRELKGEEKQPVPSTVIPPPAVTPLPVAALSETDEGLQCGDLPNVKERVKCRLSLSGSEREEEYKLRYLPEECLAQKGAQRGLCIARYKSVQTCWLQPVGDKRINCVKQEFKLGNIAETKATCDQKSATAKAACIKDLREKVYNLVKFRFDDLEERAEELEEKGVSRDSVVELVTALETKKLEFNDKITIEEKKQVILSVRDEWKTFVQKAREEMKG